MIFFILTDVIALNLTLLALNLQYSYVLILSKLQLFFKEL